MLDDDLVLTSIRSAVFQPGRCGDNDHAVLRQPRFAKVVEHSGDGTSARNRVVDDQQRLYLGPRSRWVRHSNSSITSSREEAVAALTFLFREKPIVKSGTCESRKIASR